MIIERIKAFRKKLEMNEILDIFKKDKYNKQACYTFKFHSKIKI